MQTRSQQARTRAPRYTANAMENKKTEDWGSWSENEERKLMRGLRATPAQRLAWLEEMIVLAYQSGALPRKR
jgi:hypothetical protein